MAEAWEAIRQQKDLTLPSHRVMVANIRCAEIGKAQLEAFRAYAAWQAMVEKAGRDVVPGFGQRAADLIGSALEGYEEQTRYCERGMSAKYKEVLLGDLHARVRPAFDAQLGMVSRKTAAQFQGSLAAATAGGAAPFASIARAQVGKALVQFDGLAADVEVLGTDWMGQTRAALEHELNAHVKDVR